MDQKVQIRLNSLSDMKLFPQLRENDREFLKSEIQTWPYSHQQIKQIVDIAKDLQMWRQGEISLYAQMPPETNSNLHEKKIAKIRFEHILNQWKSLKTQPSTYDKQDTYLKKTVPERYQFSKISPDDKILGRCPVASEKTLCCNLLTLDAVRNCGFDCSYCSIQSFFKEDKILVEENMLQKLEAIDFKDDELYHVGTGQSSDSLMWGNKGGILTDIITFAKKHPNIIFEFKTKSKNINYLLNNDIPSNIICTWSINPEEVIAEEEQYSATLKERLNAAKALSNKGVLVGFHFHPLFYYDGFKTAHKEICETLKSMFTPDQVAMVSLGTITFAKSVIKKIREREINTKVLQIPLQDADGKFSYNPDTKIELFKSVFDELTEWHGGKVFFYLCMENQDLWEPVFGYKYKDNNEFENAMKNSYMNKIMQLKRNRTSPQ